jgi:hypothetical protein
MTKKSAAVKKALTPQASKKKKPELSPEEIKEQITGIKQEPGRRNKQEKIQAEISGDSDFNETDQP